MGAKRRHSVNIRNGRQTPILKLKKESGIYTSGPSQQLQQSQINLANSEAAAANTYTNLSQQSLATMNNLVQPAINYNTGLVNAANSGNYSQLIQAAGPAVGANNLAGQAAQQQIRNTLPAGAGQQAALAQIPMQVGNANSSALNTAYQGALNNLTQIGAAYGGVGISEAGAGTSAANSGQAGYAQVGNQEAQGKADTMGFLGQLAGAAGSVASAGIKGCWIAEAIYGVDDERTHWLRSYLNGPFSQTVLGAPVMWLYLKIGRQVAWAIKRFPILKGVFRPLFEKALMRRSYA